MHSDLEEQFCTIVLLVIWLISSPQSLKINITILAAVRGEVLAVCFKTGMGI